MKEKKFHVTRKSEERQSRAPIVENLLVLVEPENKRWKRIIEKGEECTESSRQK